MSGANFRPTREHMHRSAAGEGKRGGGLEIHRIRQMHESGDGNEKLFGEPAVALDAEELAIETNGFFTLQTEFAFAAENIRLDRDAIADVPFFDVRPEACDFTGDL